MDTSDRPLQNGGLHAPHDSAYAPDEHSARVKELEEQVSVLTERVMENAGRFADYENEIRRLNTLIPRPASRNTSESDATFVNPPIPPIPASTTAADRPGISRFGSFMHSRKPTRSQPEKVILPTTSPREQELEIALANEKLLRTAAEQRVADGHQEIEELSTSLLQQANEMVATERRENAKLQERLKVLEMRDAERKKRLERLEAANKRIERARALLVPR